MNTHTLCFEQKYKKYQNFYLKTFSFLVLKFSIHLNRHVFIMPQADQRVLDNTGASDQGSGLSLAGTTAKANTRS